MREKIKYISDNWKEFDKKSECLEYEKHIWVITDKLSKLDKDMLTMTKNELIENILNIFDNDKQFARIAKCHRHSYRNFMRAISDCSNWYDKPYLKYYNFLRELK